MEITILGTSCMVPTKERNVQGIYLEYKGEGILIDCGEGTQRQMNIAGINRNKVRKILITHWHGDHILGIPGMLQTLSLNNYNKTLEIYGPRGTRKYIREMFRIFTHKRKIKVNIHEISSGKVFETDKNILIALHKKSRHPVLQHIRRREDVSILEVTPINRNLLPYKVIKLLKGDLS